MLLATEPVLAAPDIPSLWDAAVRLALAVGLLAAAAWAWLYWQRRGRGSSRQLEVIERSFLTRGVSLALVRVDGRRLLVGVSADGVRLIRDLDRGDAGTANGFRDALDAAASTEVGR